MDMLRLANTVCNGSNLENIEQRAAGAQQHLDQGLQTIDPATLAVATQLAGDVAALAAERDQHLAIERKNKALALEMDGNPESWGALHPLAQQAMIETSKEQERSRKVLFSLS